MVFAGIPKLAVILTLLTADGQYNEGHREERKEHTKVTLVKPGVELWLRFVKQRRALITEALLEL
jgi:hypothetical protein|tara:strand:- start:302 stop:496 length:195 start_codon:yes stop_codon:yes gene_type:complete